MKRIIFCFESNQVLVEAKKEVIERCLLHLTPFFSISSDTIYYNHSKNWRITGTVTPNLEILLFPIEREVKIAHGNKIYLNDKYFIQFDRWPVQIEVRSSKKEVIIKGKKEEEVANTLWRLIRQILIFTHEFSVEDFTLLHASAMTHNEKTIAFVSFGALPGDIFPGRHGKSLALLSCLLRGQSFSFFTDDLLIVWIEKGEVKVAGYPDYLGIYLQDVHKFPEIKGHGHYDEIRQYLLPPDLARLGIKTSAGPSRRLTHIFFINLQEGHRLKLQTIGQEKVFERIIQAVRYDHLYSDLYNPNWLDLPRKTVEQIDKSTKCIAKILAEQNIKCFTLEGIGTTEEIVRIIKNHL